MLNNEMIKSLVKISQYLEESEINVNDCQFKVLTQDEIDVEFYEHQMSLIDDLGLNSFSGWALSYILDNFVDRTYFEELHYDVIVERQEYYDDSEIDELCRMYDEYDVNKMLEIDLKEQLESMDSVEWCRDWMGDDEFCRIVENNGLINMTELVEWIKEVDGYDVLSTYDGNVYEYYENNETYYIFRTE